VSNICTWYYVVTQMMQRVNDFSVAFNRVMREEPTPVL